MVDLKKLRELVKLMATNDLTELDLQDETERITLKRGGPGTAAEPVVVAAPAPVAAVAPAPAAEAPAAPVEEDDGLLEITSPMVGTYYASSSPDAKPFIALGDTINAETVVCLVEAMKVFNEIPAEISGTIEKILVESGQAIEFGQILFKVKPS